ncbi:YfiR family protein [Alkalimonas collagenimarina]|uniref:YfiR family protein n=1 Tax=Alkalimonas collagenimarina TaxID=400390 RepID=A0ABT9H0Z8_9GAMM|nr:YfiR family protein [Alkalimonas collagenimarina]MDP4536953.1 YfiR family protein [Alkalimonas collagenimarina]
MTLHLRFFFKITFVSLSILLLTSVSAVSAKEAPKQQVSQLIPITEQVASLVLGIIRYSRWPEPLQQVDICVVGQVKHAETLLLATHFIGDVPVVSQSTSIEQVLSLTTECHLYYAGHLPSELYKQLYAAVGSSAVITIEEENEHCSIGGMFCFNINNDKATFKVNLDAVSRSSVRIHPSVLRLGQHRSGL